MHVLHVARECAPLAKAGGLGDVVGALPRAVRELAAGVECSILLPAYDWLASHRGETVLEGAVRSGTDTLRYRVLLATGVGPRDVPVLLADHPCFAGASVYGGDELLRDAVLSSAALECAARAELRVDLLHVHDHHASFACTGLAGHPAPPPRVLTVHNARYHGAVAWADAERIGLPTGLDRGSCDHDGQFNRLKAAVMHAGAVSTVSPTHARELRDQPEASHGLDYAFRMLGDRFTGILNGIDRRTWDPATDAFLDAGARYERGSLAGKQAQKAATCAELDLDATRPLLAFVGRLVPEKGIEALAAGIPALLEREPGAQVVVLGTGEERVEETFRSLERAHPRGVRVATIHDERFAHRLYAAADVLLMPSWHEPCGLSQMYALRYGTVPVVYPTGGLADSIEPFDAATGRGTGAWMEGADGAALAEAAARVLAWRREPSTWRQVVDNGMAADMSWGGSAAAHVATYRRVLPGNSGQWARATPAVPAARKARTTRSRGRQEAT